MARLQEPLANSTCVVLLLLLGGTQNARVHIEPQKVTFLTGFL